MCVCAYLFRYALFPEKHPTGGSNPQLKSANFYFSFINTSHKHTHAHSGIKTNGIGVWIGAGALCNGIATPKQCTTHPLSRSRFGFEGYYYPALATIAQLFWHLKTNCRPHPPAPTYRNPLSFSLLGGWLFFTAGAHHKFCVYNNFCYIQPPHPPTHHPKKRPTPLIKKVQRNCVALSRVQLPFVHSRALWENRK